MRILSITLSVVCLFIFTSHSYQEALFPEIKRIKEDLVRENDHGIPADYIMKSGNEMFTKIPVGDKYFVHLEYSRYFSGPELRNSVIAVYEKEKKKWEIDTIIPFYSNFELLKENLPYFISDNLECEPNGKCRSYIGIVSYKDKGFTSLSKFISYDHFRYYDHLIGINKTEELEGKIGDTITNEVALENFKWEKNVLISFDKVVNIKILKGKGEPILTEDYSARETIYIKNQD